MTIACIDVGYIGTESGETSARAGCSVIDDWADAVPTAEHVIEFESVRDYEPGQFYLRELRRPVLRHGTAAQFGHGFTAHRPHLRCNVPWPWTLGRFAPPVRLN